MDKPIDLFGLGHVSEPQIIKGSEKPEVERSHAAWKHYCNVTGRPHNEQPERRFIKTYVSQYKNGFSLDRLDMLVDGAARMSPVARDSSDVRRAIKAMTEMKASSFAEAAVEEQLDYVLCPLFQEEEESLCTLSEIADAIDLPINEWSNTEQEQAALITKLIPTEQLPEAVKKTKAVSGRKYLMPGDIIRWRRAWSNGQRVKAAKDNNRDTYEAGETQRKIVAKIDKDSDYAAERLLIMGYDPEEVLKFHLDNVPEGYWERYSEVMDEIMDKHPKWSMSEIHDEVAEILEPDYRNWNPSKREMPNG